MKPTQWQILPFDEQVAEHLHDTLKIPPLFCQLLAQRSITTFEAARQFFRPQMRDLHNPFLMKDMEFAVERLDVAIRRKERILLYGDYDVDGTTSVALMYDFLSKFYSNIDYYLPDRDKEGYGVSLAGVEYARSTGVTLIIAMDCGIKAHEAVAKARNYDIDFIICDHHLPEGGLPEAVANLDPKRSDCDYPYKELSGCGIAFKLAQALALHYNTPAEEIEGLLDLVAVSTACDIVPMTGENRILARHGMWRFNRAPRIGLWALTQRTSRAYPLTISDIVFGIGPLINAAGRLGDAREAVQMLLAADRNSALERAGQLVRRNRERREVDYATADEARRRFEALPDWESRKSVVLFDPDWHKGIIGIVASRVAETYHKPTIILTQSNGRAVGSARSIRGFDLYAALQHCENLFFSYGGHAHAAGMQMPVENVDAFVEAFENVVRQHIRPEMENPVVDISAQIRLDDITPQFWKTLRQFEPFGPQNRNPVFWATAIVDAGQSKMLDNNHVRLSLRHTDSQVIFNGIGFDLGHAFEAVRGGPFELAFNLREEEWRGERKLTLVAKDIRKMQPA
jgi:single-stranded-DNA-specific exonuclease